MRISDMVRIAVATANHPMRCFRSFDATGTKKAKIKGMNIASIIRVDESMGSFIVLYYIIVTEKAILCDSFSGCA
ncbi:MAG: hypothetical protein P1P72_02715 [ANME-2 cluster archaeon]|nr:hypothetical protein [ANME-2 cluster archaeon]